MTLRSWSGVGAAIERSVGPANNRPPSYVFSLDRPLGRSEPWRKLGLEFRARSLAARFGAKGRVGAFALMQAMQAMQAMFWVASTRESEPERRCYLIGLGPIGLGDH
jgi:hypothetical protein